MMAVFSVIVLTAAPPGQAAEGGGAFVKIDGREALLKSVELFLNRENVKQIQAVVVPEAMEEAKRKYGGHFGFSGVKLVAAGPRWVDQLAGAAEKVSAEATHVIVHDGARPIVPYSDIDALMDAAAEHSAVALTAPLRASVAEVDEGGNALAVELPSKFVQLLTPAAYAREKLVEIAKSRADVHPSELTLVKGSPLNIRIGGGGDAAIARAFLNLLPKPKPRALDNPFEEAQW